MHIFHFYLFKLILRLSRAPASLDAMQISDKSGGLLVSVCHLCVLHIALLVHRDECDSQAADAQLLCQIVQRVAFADSRQSDSNGRSQHTVVVHSWKGGEEFMRRRTCKTPPPDVFFSPLLHQRQNWAELKHFVRSEILSEPSLS